MSIAEIIRCEKHNVSWTIDGDIDKDHHFRKCITCMAEEIDHLKGEVEEWKKATGEDDSEIQELSAQNHDLNARVAELDKLYLEEWSDAVDAQDRVAELEGALEVQKVFTKGAIQVVGKYRTALEKIRGLKQNCQWPLSGKTNTPCSEEGVNNPWVCEYCIATEALEGVKDATEDR